MTGHDPRGDTETVIERFRPSNGRFSGVLGLVTAGVVLVLAILARDTGTPLGVAIIALFGAVVAWAALLRPVVWATDRDLVLRNMVHTDRVPLAAIDKVAVGQVLAVSAGGKRFVSPAIGHSARQTVMTRRSGAKPTAGESYPVFVEERIAHLAHETRERLGIAKGSPEQQALAAEVSRQYAWLEIGGLAVTAVAFLVWLAL